MQKEMATHPVFYLGNPMDREARRAIDHVVTKESDTRPGISKNNDMI